MVPTAFCYNGGRGRCRSNAPGDWFAAVLYSDDFGKSFAVSNKEEGGNECQAARLANGSLILNQRTRGPLRQLSYSHDAGVHWSKPRPVVLGGPGAATCCGSTVFISSANTNLGIEASNAPDGILVFSGPDSAGRKNMSIYTSRDFGYSWQQLYQIGDPSLAGGYSSLAVINVRLSSSIYCATQTMALKLFLAFMFRALTSALHMKAPTFSVPLFNSRS